MTSLRPAAGRSPREWIKLALIPVLGLVLLTLLWGPSEEASPPPSAALAVEASRATVGLRIAQPVHRADTPENWPTTSLEHITRLNPFAQSVPLQKMLGVWVEPSPLLPPPVADPLPSGALDRPAQAKEVTPAVSPAAAPATPEKEEAAQPAAAIDVSQLATLQAITESHGEFRALINSRIYRPGDRLLDEYEILAITRDRVTVVRRPRSKNGEAP